MDVGTNKTRKDTRAVVSLVARYRSPNTFEYVEEACCDVSLGGMFIRSKDPASAGTLLKLECESGVGGQIRGVARVVWLRAQPSEYGPSGMGVKFVKLDPESKDVITRIVQELAAEGIESPSMSSAPENRGKPPVKRATSSTPAAADSQLPAAEPVSNPAFGASHAPPKEHALAQQRGSEHAHAAHGTNAAGPRISSKPPALPRVSSRPAPNDALLAHASVDSLELAPGPSMQDIGRDLGPIAPVSRSARISSVPPPPDNDRGRAFWLVAGAVVALGVIVAIFSTRSAEDTAPAEAKGASPAVQAPPPVEPVAEPAQPSAAELANTQPAANAAEDNLAAAPPDSANDTAAAAPSDSVATPAVPSTPDVAQVPVATPTAADAPAKSGIPSSAEHAAAPAATTPAKPAATAQPSAPSAAPSAPPVAAAAPEVPVLRITQADPAPAQPQAAAQPAADAPQPAAANPANSNKPTSQPSAASNNPAPSNNAAASDNAAATSTASAPSTHASSPSPSPSPNTNTNAPPPPLAPGEIAHVIMFTSRPSGASIFVGNQSLVTPGELNIGAMPTRVRVTAQKPGFESSTVWINNVAEFQKVGGVMRREVHFVLPALPAGAAPAPSATQQSAPNNAAAPAQPTPPAESPTPPPSAAIPAQP